METSSFSSPFLYMSEDFRQFSLTILLVPLPLVLSRRQFHASSPHIRRRVVSCFPPFVVLFFLSPFLRGPSLARTVTIREEERSQRNPEFPSTPGMSRTCDEDQTFIKRDQNVYPPTWPSTKRVCEKNLRVHSCACRAFRDDRNSVREDRGKI